MEKLLYSVTEAAEFLGLAKKTIYNSISSESGRPFIKPRWYGSKPLFHINDLRAWADGLPKDSKPKKRAGKTA
jgi:excisionase family DNA binding protein